MLTSLPPNNLAKLVIVHYLVFLGGLTPAKRSVRVDLTALKQIFHEPGLRAEQMRKREKNLQDSLLFSAAASSLS